MRSDINYIIQLTLAFIFALGGGGSLLGSDSSILGSHLFGLFWGLVMFVGGVVGVYQSAVKLRMTTDPGRVIARRRMIVLACISTAVGIIAAIAANQFRA